MIQFIDTSSIELFCFALSDDLSWWGTNISRTVEHFVPLSNMNTMVSCLHGQCDNVWLNSMNYW
jgi:protein O-GlcNAc transferase